MIGVSYRLTILFTISAWTVFKLSQSIVSTNPNSLRAEPLSRRDTTTAFDLAYGISYGKAIQGDATAERPDFDLSTWTETSKGGLTDSDRILLSSLYREATSVFEYGLGESTRIANAVKVPRYAGIDSDPTWVVETRKGVAPHFRFYLADVGETEAWGQPVEKLSKQSLDYQLAPLQSEQQSFDVYMVDGRWRVASVLASFLHASSRGPNKTPKVLLHDCKSRPRYQKLHELLDLVDKSERLCVFERKSSTMDADLLELWKEEYEESN